MKKYILAQPVKVQRSKEEVLGVERLNIFVHPVKAGFRSIG